MSKKKPLALLLAALMLVTLFAACSDKTTTDDDSSDKSSTQTSNNETTADVESTSEDQTADSDTSESSDLMDITFMCINQANKYNYYEAEQAGFYTIQYLEDQAAEQDNIHVVRTVIEEDAYDESVTGNLAAGTMPNIFYSYYLGSDEFLTYVDEDYFLNIDDILEYSDGTSSGMLSEGGSCTFVRALSLMENGGWYRMGVCDGNGTYFNFDHDDVDYINNWPMHTWYNLAIRRDWLDDCGLDMPQTTEEFYDALLAFQENDCNGDGAKDERAMLGIDMNNDTVSGQLFSNGVAQWFGLPTCNWDTNPATAEVSNAIEAPTYLDFIQYMKRLYDAGLTYTSEGGAWSYTTNVATNQASCYVQYPERMCEVSCETFTGDPNAQYDQMPIIQAVEGVKPIVIGQSATASYNGISFMNDCDPKAAAAFLDFLYSKTFYITLDYGIEGKAWDYNDDGTVTIYTDLSEDDDLSYGDCWHWIVSSYWPQCQVGWEWDFSKKEYTSFEEALDNGEPFAWKYITEDEWKEQNANCNWDTTFPLKNYYEMLIDYGTDYYTLMGGTSRGIAYTDEAQVVTDYGTELTTYLSSMSIGYITGSTDISTYEEDLQYAYDNLGFAEYTSAMQSQSNRFFANMGHSTFEG